MTEANGVDDRVRIVFPDRGAGGLGLGTRIFTGGGDQVQHVKSIEILPITPGDAITAKIELHLDLCDLWAHPLLGMESLKRAAGAYGMALIPAESASAAGQPALEIEMAVSEDGSISASVMIDGERVASFPDPRLPAT